VAASSIGLNKFFLRTLHSSFVSNVCQRLGEGYTEYSVFNQAALMIANSTTAQLTGLSENVKVGLESTQQ